MNEILKTTLLGLFFGTFGTTLGGIIGINFKNPSNKILSFILSLASGLMIAVVCFELVPEATNISNIPTAILGIIAGIIMMIFCDIFELFLIITIAGLFSINPKRGVIYLKTIYHACMLHMSCIIF